MFEKPGRHGVARFVVGYSFLFLGTEYLVLFLQTSNDLPSSYESPIQRAGMMVSYPVDCGLKILFVDCKLVVASCN